MENRPPHHDAIGYLEAITLPGIGVCRLASDENQRKARKGSSARRQERLLAASVGRGLKQWGRMPSEHKQAVWWAYKMLISPTNVPRIERSARPSWGLQPAKPASVRASGKTR